MFFISRYRVSDKSMEPYLHAGDYVLASKLFFKLKKEDVVIFKQDNKHIIKRLKNVKSGKYFLEGDNRKLSKSYQIAKDNIVGKVVLCGRKKFRGLAKLNN